MQQFPKTNDLVQVIEGTHKGSVGVLAGVFVDREGVTFWIKDGSRFGVHVDVVKPSDSINYIAVL